MDECNARRIHESCASEVRPKGRPRIRWLKRLNEALRARGLDVEQAKPCVGVTVSWRKLYRSSDDLFYKGVAPFMNGW